MTTPTVTNVAGVITTGQVLTLTGTDMIDEVRTNYDSWFTAQRSGFEGASVSADNWDTAYSAPDLQYDTTVKLRGSKSMRMLMQGVHRWPPGDGVTWGWRVAEANNAWSSGQPKNVYIRGYLRWNYYDSVTGLISWLRRDNSSGNPQPFKKLWWADNAGLTGFTVDINCNDDGSPPTAWNVNLTKQITGVDGTTSLGNFPDGALKNNRWYCFEFQYSKAGSGGPYTIEGWVDNVSTSGPISCVLGMEPSNTFTIESKVNEWNTNATWIGYEWCDELAVSTSRIRPLSIVEIGNSSNYATATKVYQAPELFSDTSSQCVCNLAGLGAGPYWLFVTNSLGQTSAAFNLGGASPTLSAGFVASVTSTTGIPTVTTDTGNGTLWEVVVPNGDVPSHAQIKAGQQSSGAAALDAQSMAITSAGTKIFAAIAAQTSATPFDCYFLQTDINANDSLAFKADFTTLSGVGGGVGTGTLFISEPFENSNFSTRGWYDGVDCPVDVAVVNPPGGLASLKYHWDIGTTTVVNTPKRHLFQASDSFYLSWWMKLGSSASQWVGSGVAYHPHLIQVMTDAETNEFTGPSRPWLTIRIEPHDFTARISVSDGQRINIPQLGVNLLGTATAHAVAGGNGNQDASATYFNGPLYENNFDLNSSGNVFVNNTWHFCEVYVQMNTIVGGLPLLNGIMRYWVDGALVVSSSTIELRTAQYATQKFNQLLLVPYIGVGSPASQDIWVDSLLLWTARAGESGFPAVSVPSVVPRFSFVLP